MGPVTRHRAFDLLPLAALLGVWLVAGLASAVTVAVAEGHIRHVALGIVTLPALLAITRAVRVVRTHGRFASPSSCARDTR
jgi:hypothetical protein